MIKPSLQQLLYFQSLDTWAVSGVAEVNAQRVKEIADSPSVIKLSS